MSSPSPSPTSASDHEAVTVGVRTSPRPKARTKAAPLAKLGMALFAIGLVAIFADMIMFTAGNRNLPLWINVVAMLAPVGLGLGLIGVVRENRE